MSTVPPPVYVPSPPPPHRPPMSPSSVAALTAGAILLLFILLSALIFVSRRFAGPKVRKGWNQPVAGTPLVGGWSLYHIAPLGLSIASLGPPRPELSVNAKVKYRPDISEYVNYRMQSHLVHALVTGYWMRRSTDTLESRANYEANRLEVSYPKYKSLTKRALRVGGKPAMEVTVVHPWKGKDWELKDVLTTNGSVHYFIQGNYPQDAERNEEKAFDYMVQSVKFDAAK